MSDYTILLFSIILLAVIVTIALFAMSYLWRTQKEQARETKYNCTEKAMQSYADHRAKDERRHMHEYVEKRLREHEPQA